MPVTINGSSGLTANDGSVFTNASGNVGIGTNSPLCNLDVVSGSGTVQRIRSTANSGANTLYQNSGTGTTASDGLYIGIDTVAGYLWNWESQPLILATSGSERMRIDSSGNLLVGTTSATDASGVGTKIRTTSSVGVINCTFDSASSGSTFQLYNIAAGVTGYRFYVNFNGGIANYSANNQNISDLRTKDRIELAGGYLKKICEIPVKLFNYKGEPEGSQKSLGVIAQEVEAVAPELVSNDGFGETPEDGVPLKTIYQTDLQYALMKCIQELKAELDTVKAELATLKGVE